MKTASKTTTYVYDTANQLLRENNEAAGKTWTYSYDSAGNILTKKEYAYTTGTLGAVLDSISYVYSDGDWGDLLTSYDGHAITYDGVGNPLTDGTWTYTWEHGRQLASMSKAGTTWTYTYDADGMRTSRSNGSNTYRYVYNGGKLRQMTVGDDTLQFMYDANGVPMSMLHNGTLYYYVTNIQGDVVAILNTTGTAVVAYSYDAWGNATATTDSMAATLGVLNPLRYRGYVFDTETGLYYLQSRYFNPQMARFINADDPAYLGADGALLTYNLFAYCRNNPIMQYDSTGHWSWSWKEQAALGTAVLVAGLALLLAAPTGGSSLVVGTAVLSSATTVAAGGAMVVTGTVMTGDALAQATVSYAKQSKKSGKERASDKPSWVSQSDVDLNKSSQKNATDLLNSKYGSGNWRKGPKTEYNQIVKWIDRGLKIVVWVTCDMLMESE